MNVNDKLKGFPHIRFINLDQRPDRREWMETQFEKYGITDYARISANRYGPQNYDEWKNKLVIADEDNFIRKDNICYVSILVNQLQSMIDWYNDNISETCIIAEDDLNIGTFKFWTFDWEYFCSRLPCNWDCVQLHVIGSTCVPMGLTRRSRDNHGATAYLINRTYVEKLIQMHYNDGKFIFYNNYGYGNDWPEYHYQSPDFVPYEIGVTYTFPIFITNSIFDSNTDEHYGKSNPTAKKSDYITAKWWKYSAKNYSVNELFSLHTPRRKELNISVRYNRDEVLGYEQYSKKQHQPNLKS